MEHRLILGGEQFLPFARSCITKLKKLGLPYANQSYEVDGVSIKVRIEPGHEYIRLEGGSVELAMDSGIIDVGAARETNPDRFLPGSRYSVPPYERSFTKPSRKTPWYLNPNKPSVGQLAGIIAVSSMITGKVRTDGVAESFSPQTTGTNPDGSRVVNEADETLLAKKRAGIYCPASMFTGRARLYAQAMYGQHLYERASGPEVDTARPTPVWTPQGIPALVLPGYIDPDVERRKAFSDKVEAARLAHVATGSLWPFQGPYGVTLNINSGVYLDPVSKKHWLINPGNDSVTIYPMVSSRAGEAVRKWLNSPRLTTVDSEHLEAYILSSCCPHVEVAVTIATASIGAYASGYGWHWNWSGTVADMVQVISADEGSQQSTHYRMTATASYSEDTKETSWVASSGTVSGPHRWATQTPVCCVTHPNWANRYTGDDPYHPPVYWSEKLPYNHDPLRSGPIYPSSAPIYAFYKKDVLQLVTFSLDIADEKPGYIDASDRFVEMIPGGGPTAFHSLGLTVGNDAGYLHVTLEVGKLYTYTIDCSGARVAIKRGGTKRGYATDDGAKTEISVLPALSDNYYGTMVDVITLKSGRPPDGAPAYSTTGHEKTQFSGGTYSYQGYSPPILSQFTSTRASVEETLHGTAGGIIPFYDAEAFYLVQDTWEEKLEHTRTTNTQSGYYVWYDSGKGLVSVLGGYEAVYFGWSRYEILTNPTFTTAYSPIPDKLTVLKEEKKMIGVFAAGQATAAAPPPSTYSMFENGDYDYVEETFATIGSAGSEKIFRGLVEQNWPDGGLLVNPVIVGWA